MKIAGAKPITFLAEVREELSRVIWPSRRETLKLTLIVIGVSAAVGLFLGGLDFLLTKLTEAFLK